MTWQDISTAPKDGTLRVPLTRGQFAAIDAADLPLVKDHSWQARPRRDGNGYYACNSSGRRMHRLLMGVSDERIVDHRDGDGLNNRRCNIRVGTQSLNCVNRRVTPGPYLRGAQPKKRKWRAQIKDGGKMKSLGYFDTERDAHEAWLAESHRLHGDWQPLPPPPSTEDIE